MVSSFTRSTPVLDFGPRSHVRYEGNQWLLWPAWCYRVIAPDDLRRQLNTLERLVLDMCAVGSKTAVRIAELVPLDAELIAFIMGGLQSRQLLDAAGSPTSDGLAVLGGEDRESEPESVRTGYVFQDPWTHELWPRMAERLLYAEVSWNAKYPRLVIGGATRRRPVRAFMVFPNDAEQPARPRPESILEAVRRHRRSARASFSDVNDGDYDDPQPTPRELRRVSYVTEKPEPVFLSTFAYFAHDDELDWLACDPFGLGVSPALRRAIEDRASVDPAFERVIDGFVGRSPTFRKGIEEYREFHSTLQASARATICARLTSDVLAHPAFEALVSVELMVQQAKWLGERCPDTYVVSARADTRTCLEKTLAHVATGHPLTHVWKRLYLRPAGEGERELRQKEVRVIYAAAAEALGLDPLPEQLLTVRPRLVQSLRYPNASYRLNPSLVATVLAAYEQKHHPLGDIAVRHPAIVGRMAALATKGGAAVHDFTADVGELEQDAEDLYQTVGLLSGLPYEKSPSYSGGIV